ncbi:MAG: DUF3085 domain-containing protein [Pseudomonadota bacterium]
MPRFQKLKFDKRRVEEILGISRDAKKRTPTFGQMYDPAFRKDGKAPPEGEWPSAEDVDPAKLPPGLHLIKDQGIYLTANAADLPLGEDSRRPDVVYADGFDPDAVDFDDWWDRARDVMGGDDQVIFVTEEQAAHTLATARGPQIIIEVKTDKLGQYVEYVRA